jgi:glycosyltransferase involved in cell wall biosynthesis
LSRWLWHVERAALKLADIILVDTDQHGQYFSTTFGISGPKFITVPVGAEQLFWDARNRPAVSLPLDIFPPRYALFYGQLIPLHGIDTILEAVSLTERVSIPWVIVGRGQDEAAIRKYIERQAPKNMTWIPWVDYHSLPDMIRRATVSLGIFGRSDKAARVIPNKMFQILAAGGSIITRESPPAAALANRFPRSIRLVPPGDANALAEAVIEAFDETDTIPVPVSAQGMLSPGGGVEELIRALEISRSPNKCTQ